MKIRLIDVDSRIPNLALMQISAYHKAQGDEVGWDVPDPDWVYLSCIFSKNAAKARGIATLYPKAVVSLGGSGINYNWLPEPMQKIAPDYDLYPSSYSLGFTTRGCVRRCGFCVVPEKEGRLQRWQHIREFHDPRFKAVVVLDNNVYADRDWFFENTDFVLEQNLAFNAIQGMDIRLLTEEIAIRLAELKWFGRIHFAFDSVRTEKEVLRGIELLKQVGFDTRNRVTFYVLVGYDSTFEEDLYRVNLLREQRVNSFVMKYRSRPDINNLARWANKPQLYWQMPFAEYIPNLKGASKKQEVAA